jgi:hypothetical protein
MGLCEITHLFFLSLNTAHRPFSPPSSLHRVGTYNYASDRQLREVTLGRADDIECLGYALLELYLGKPWW